jgi:hypothetical protein
LAARRAVAQEGRGVERQQHRHRARRDIGEALAGGAVELAIAAAHRPAERIDRASSEAPRPNRLRR